MHLEGPWLSTSGKKKGKQKFRNADQARKSRELDASWQDLLKKYEPTNTKKTVAAVKSPVVQTAYRRETPKINSLPFTGGACTKVEPQRYTGTLIKGIATMHKSNAVPIINDQDAVDIAKMRR